MTWQKRVKLKLKVPVLSPLALVGRGAYSLVAQRYKPIGQLEFTARE